jgi:hypothetical protein
MLLCADLTEQCYTEYLLKIPPKVIQVIFTVCTDVRRMASFILIGPSLHSSSFY